MRKVRLKRRAREQLPHLPPAVIAALDDAFMRLATDPHAAGKELRGTLRGTWSLTVPGSHGGYRVLYKIRDDVIVESIRPRPTAYRRARR